MSKRIQAYFRTEDDAEGARISLHAFATEQLEVGELDSSIGRSNRILVPLVPYNNVGGVNTTGAVGTAAGTQTEGIVPVVSDRNPDEPTAADRNGNREGGLLNAEDVFTDDYDNLHYVLSVKVKDEEYEEVVNKIRSKGGYVEIDE
ncbi:hypothetical protein TCA2_4776 [Paenibacillus sp. TCA20]|uniref:Uncharacterized protein n=1 Tax=Paenibacillus urinalis TaxID=521520 RepID=A0AAX3MXL1_9BACL|nr:MULTISPECIES: hypothetical protein [Paenibacillus]WDH81773.1 hypothetical protein PUW23_20005 [Paenibacillus urinalis]GAK42284.1 hypothetical protein TCA2_4776 [Paenibacillus sp. TCA20]